MRFSPTELDGVVVVDPEPVEDERGLFARTFCAEELAAAGLDPAVSQCSVSFNPRSGTLRGMHLQRAPHGEAKLVRCTRGAIFDVAVDARLGSPTFGRWVAQELTADNRRALYLPPGVAHGLLTLEADCEVFYQISVPYHGPSAAGFRWDDPAVGIAWPRTPSLVSERDRLLPTLAELGQV